MTSERLGTRGIQGLRAVGVNATTLGTAADGEWNGKPIRETEIWVFDDLSRQLVKIDRDLRSGAILVSNCTASKGENQAQRFSKSLRNTA